MIFKKGLPLVLLLASIFLLAPHNPLYSQVENRVPFKHRVGHPAPDNNLFRIRGDFAIIGNTNLTLADYVDEKDNSLNEMVYVDIDQDSATYNSSSATLVFSGENGADAACSDILYAGLYWSGRAKDGLGLTFEVNVGEIPGLPQEISAEVQQVVYNDSIHYSSYDYHSIYLFDENGLLFPRYILWSKTDLEEIIFEFGNDPQNRVQYSIGDDILKPVTNLQITTSGNVIIATFDPITFFDNGVEFSIDRITRTSGTDYYNYLQEHDTMQITADGIFTPLLPKLVQFDKRKVKFKGPAAANYTEITATGNNILFPFEELREMYVGYADVTDYVRAQGMGKYTLADMALTEGRGDNTGTFGHWGLIVIYQNPKMHWRDVTVFDGYSLVQALDFVEHTGEIEIEGFGTVQNGPVDLKLGVMAGEGDRSIEGDFLEIINQEGEWVRLHHPLNTTDNFFNSSIYTPVSNSEGELVQNPRSPNLLNNTGIDIVQWDIPNEDNSIITNNQTSTRFRFGTRQDVYNIYAFAFSVRSYLPVIQALNQLVSINGESPGIDPSVKPADEITFNLEIRNLGDEGTENTQIVVPLPYNTSFVSAHTVPSGYGNISFDPGLGVAGSIIWEVGEVPLGDNPQDLIASLQYTLKVTDDCQILANNYCEATILINGGVSGQGSNSQTIFSNTPFIQGIEEVGCEGKEIFGAMEIPITGVMEFVEANCGDFEMSPGLSQIALGDFCQGEPPVTLSNLILPSQEGFSVFFFSDEASDSPLFDYNVNTSVPGTETVWVSEGPTSSCTGIRVPVVLNVLPRTPAPIVNNIWICSTEGLLEFGVYPNEDYEFIYYPDNDPLSTPLDSIPQVDLSIPGIYTVWVSHFKEGECESRRREVKMEVPDCSLYPEIKVSITPDKYAYSFEGETVTYTIELENTGSLPLTEVYLMESRTQSNWNIPKMEPGEKLTFTVTYTITNEDLTHGMVNNYTYATGYGGGTYGGNVGSEDDVSIFVLPEGFLDYEVKAVDENCPTNGDALGSIELQFQNERQTGSYLLVRQEDGKEFTGIFENAKTVNIKVPAGIYNLSIFDSNNYEHEIPGSFEVKKRNLVDFSVPTEVTACLLYEFMPESLQNLEYRVKGPDGIIIFPNQNGHFELSKSGIYSVQGIDSSGEKCPIEKTFDVAISQPSVIEFEVMPFCSGQAFTTVQILQNTQNLLLRWYKMEAGTEVYLPEADDNEILFVENEGEYLATLTDSEGCLVGRGRTQVRMTNLEAPLLKILYTICSGKKVGARIEPGSDFIGSVWYRDGVEVSDALVFVAESAGMYTLVATDRFGCAHEVSFEVEDKCKSTLRYPGAIIPMDPNKAFVIYPDNLIEWMEVLIQNRWGELIYFCGDRNPRTGQPSSCIWDGTVNGKKVINGSYFVQIRYGVKDQGEILTERGVVLVLD